MRSCFACGIKIIWVHVCEKSDINKTVLSTDRSVGNGFWARNCVICGRRVMYCAAPRLFFIWWPLLWTGTEFNVLYS